MIYIFLIDGFEEIEAVATVDVLRRAGLEVRTVSLTGSRTVQGAHGIPVVADTMFEQTSHSEPPTGGVEPTTSREQSRTKFELCRGAKEEGEHLFVRQSASEASLLIIPGGTIAYAEHEGMKQAVHGHYENGGRVAAICAAPAVLGMLGILKGRRATCYPGYEGYCEGASICAGEAVVVDDRIITGRGPGLTLPFALTVVEVMAGREKRDEVASQLLLA